MSTASHPLHRYGWNDTFAAGFGPYEAEGLRPGRVVRVDRGSCEVVAVEDGQVVSSRADTWPVASADLVNNPCTGDWVALDPDQKAVRALLPRRTAFVRAVSSQRSEGQVLAANIDQLLIVVSLADELDLGRVERFLSLAWASGGQPVVVLTKADLVPDPVTRSHLVEDTERVAPGARVLCVSAASGQGIATLAALVGGADAGCGGTAALLGRSGAGKSTLANALTGADVQRVAVTRDSDGKGRHTTTTRDLLPLPGGGVLIDTPGLRGVGLWEADTGVPRTFPDIEALARECRFHDCAHGVEPGCAVRAAAESGELPLRRLGNYRKLLRENERIAARSDARLDAEMLRSWKQKTTLGRHMRERKRGPQGPPR
ncbi:ribosome small subunit-dependent GTPase A [Streptomyces nitrosporeus]|uniref:Small ribosomal subunit biogenesis GTPase RsgA n=1 Tax=Streptomyces nitrosporeus TaxID=28894 RepID=A0A5J6FCL9_9ACTN|nr:ribosome small subunit-dependent GTPase A [Streptomyces nitrosporeus]QEU72735.1 ribosome small subunit-dependent GTPase A [Streptomyces nitrosporeus]GGY75530.1 putative ribosome biogenesis GTPase RsgA [Streptomyces nitrosporeus]